MAAKTSTTQGSSAMAQSRSRPPPLEVQLKPDVGRWNRTTSAGPSDLGKVVVVVCLVHSLESPFTWASTGPSKGNLYWALGPCARVRVWDILGGSATERLAWACAPHHLGGSPTFLGKQGTPSTTTSWRRTNPTTTFIDAMACLGLVSRRRKIDSCIKPPAPRSIPCAGIDNPYEGKRVFIV
jgi:hypothetical protein